MSGIENICKHGEVVECCLDCQMAKLHDRNERVKNNTFVMLKIKDSEIDNLVKILKQCQEYIGDNVCCEPENEDCSYCMERARILDSIDELIEVNKTNRS